MALSILRNLILQTHMRRHTVGLDVWFSVGPFAYFHISCVRPAKTARMRTLAWAFTVRLCDKYHNLVSWRKCGQTSRRPESCLLQSYPSQYLQAQCYNQSETIQSKKRILFSFCAYETSFLTRIHANEGSALPIGHFAIRLKVQSYAECRILVIKLNQNCWLENLYPARHIYFLHCPSHYPARYIYFLHCPPHSYFSLKQKRIFLWPYWMSTQNYPESQESKQQFLSTVNLPVIMWPQKIPYTAKYKQMTSPVLFSF